MFAEQYVALLLLVLASMGAGWLLAHRRRPRKANHTRSFPRLEYLKGLNYLVNEEQDKAIEIFLRMVEVDSETVETHFALASLFRRRGEVDRAIRLHQNLIARPNLSRAHRNQALRELGDDYMRAGLLDRAESLFQELSKAPPHRRVALQHLASIYEQQKDWNQAIEICRKLAATTDADLNHIIAHYFCELARERNHSGDRRAELTLLKRAQAFDRTNVRVGIMMGDLALRTNNPRVALRHFRRALSGDIAFATDILPWIAEAYRQLDMPDGLDSLVDSMTTDDPTAVAPFAVATILSPELTTAAMERCVNRYVHHSPSLEALRDVILDDGEHRNGLEVHDLVRFKRAMRRLLSEGEGYRCVQCGYAGKTLYWQCPSCRAWGLTKPYHEFSLATHFPATPTPYTDPVRMHGT